MYMTDVSVRTTDGFDKCVGALVYYIDTEDEERRTYPSLHFDHDIVDGCGMMCSVLTLNIGNSRGTGGVEFGKIYGDYFSLEFLRLFDGPSCNVVDMTDANVCTTDDFAKCVGAPVYYVGLENEECKIAYPNLLFKSSNATSSAATA